MQQITTQLTIETERQGLLEITDRIIKWTGTQTVTVGLLTVFCRHTSASLLIQENAAKAVRMDIETYFARLAPEDPLADAHDDEGPQEPSYPRRHHRAPNNKMLFHVPPRAADAARSARNFSLWN